MAIYKKKNRVLKVNDFETTVFPPTITLKLKFKIDTKYINIYIEL
jgi:hypothetical protein